MRALEALAVATLVLGVMLAAFHPIYSVDFFWHLKLGEVIADTHAIPRTNLFSSAEPARPYVQFNWLWDLGAAYVVRVFGFHGFRVAQVLLLGASFLLLYGRARSLLRLPELAFAFSTLAFVLFEDRFQERPSALLLGFLAALLPLLLDYQRTLARRTYLFVLVLAVLWANVHGGESVLLVCSLGALVAGELCTRLFLRERAERFVQSAILLGLALLALAASPTALPGLWDWAHAIGPQISIGNEEWQPSYTMLRNGLRPAFVLIALGPSLVALLYSIDVVRRVRREGRPAIAPSEWFLCVGYLVLAHQAVRNSFLCLVPLAFMLRRFVDGAGSVGAGARTRWICALTGWLLLGIALEDALPYSYGGLARIPELMRYDLAPDEQPELAADFLTQAKLEGGLINDGRWGGYLIYRVWPRSGVFADTRHHFTPEMFQVFSASHDALRRAAALDAAFVRWGIELAVFRGPTFPLLAAPPSWRLLYKAGDQEIYQHVAGKHAAANLARAQRWLNEHGASLPDSADREVFAAEATRVGAQRYLSTPDHRLRLARSALALRDADPQVAGGAARERGLFFYRAGLYAGAAPLFELALGKLGFDTQAAYCGAFSHFANGETAASLALAQRVLAQPNELTPRQRDRLILLTRTLSSARRGP